MKTIISELPRWSNFRRGVYSLDIGYPWLTYGAIITLENAVGADAKVLEVGSGGSTIFFGRRCQSVKSFETDAAWENKIRPYLKDLPNVILICKSPDEILEVLKSEPDDYYDVVLIDSNPWQSDRRIFADATVPKIKKGGFLVLDNYTAGSKKALRRLYGRENWYDDFDWSKWDVYTFDQFHWGGRGTRICIKL